MRFTSLQRRLLLAPWLALVLACGMAPTLRADEWPQFRGPDGQGHAGDVELPLVWSETEGVAWKTALPGLGWSSPVVAQGRIWLTTALDEGRDLRALCVDLATGKLLHDVPLFQPVTPLKVHATNGHASPTPVLEDERVYVHFGANGTASLDASTGEVLWKSQELVVDHEVGPGSSPVLHGDRLILNCDGTDLRYVAALDKHSGKLAWRTERSGVIDKEGTMRKAFCTPLVVRVDDHDELISPAAERVVAYDPQTGEELWHVRYEGFSNVPRPIFAHGFVYVCTGFMQAKLLAIRPGGRGDVTDSHVAWQAEAQIPTKPSPLAVDDMIYLVDDAGIAQAIDALSGEVRWRKRLGGKFSASPLAVDDHVLLFCEDGTTHVLAPGDAYQSLAQNQLDGQIMATPAVADGALLLRTDTHLYRIQK